MFLVEPFYLKIRPHLDFAIVALFPDPVRRVEADGLEKEHERHPLVVRVVDPLVVVAVWAWKKANQRFYVEDVYTANGKLPDDTILEILGFDIRLLLH